MSARGDFEAGAFEVSARVIVEEIDGQLLMLDMKRNAYFGLNPVGLLIWRELEQGASMAQLVQRLTAGFEVDEAQARADASGFVALLLERGFISARELDGRR